MTVRERLLRHMMERIAKCEGGTVKSATDNEGNTLIVLSPDIPPAYWCDTCKAIATCKARIAGRWAKQLNKG